MAHSSVLEAGREAYSACRWAQAYADLSAADASGGLGTDDLERLATVAYLTGHDDDSVAAWTRAHRAHLDADDPAGAVRCAFWLGFGCVLRGDVAQGGGWLARARSLATERQLDCVETGYLLVPTALLTMGAGDCAAAYDLCASAGAVGERFGDRDLVAIGRLGCGQALLRMGQPGDGFEQLDEAMVSVTAGEVSPAVAGILYCAVIDECQHALDVRRAREWTEALTRWCDEQPDLVPYRGQCLVHRAQVMQLQGRWVDALDEAERARTRLETPPHPAVGMAHYQLGELHRLRGELDRSEEAYRCANDAGRSPQPGLALLRLAQGRPHDATAAIVRALDEASDPVARASLLPAAVEILLATGRRDDARQAADELSRMSGDGNVPFLCAASEQAQGAVLLAEGEPKAALEALRSAWRRWRDLDAPYEAARVRLAIAEACQELHDDDGAQLECAAARRVFDELGARPAVELLDDVLLRHRTSARRSTDHAATLAVTPRELDVLRLVARGGTNRQIADQLTISEKTVERHVSNILGKLGLPNRAAATAYAYVRGLV